MTVDKFGRAAHPAGKGGRQQQGPPGVGFKLTINKDFDVERKKICNLANPQNDMDAVNMQSTLVIKSTDDYVSARKRRLIDLKEPIAESDAVTKKYVHDAISKISDHILSQCMLLEPTTNQNFYARNKQINAVAQPSKDEDATNKKYVDKEIKRKIHKIQSKLHDTNEVINIEVIDKIKDINEILKLFYILISELVENVKRAYIQLKIDLVQPMNMKDLNTTYRNFVFNTTPDTATASRLQQSFNNFEDDDDDDNVEEEKDGEKKK